MAYTDFGRVEKKWIKYWDEHKTFHTDLYDFSKPKYYVLDMFPYPSGAGLHVGPPLGYIASDIYSVGFGASCRTPRRIYCDGYSCKNEKNAGI